MKSTMHRIPALLCGVTALVLSAGALANGQDRSTAAQPQQNSTAQPSTMGSNNSNASNTDMSRSTASADSSSATAQTKFDQLDADHDGSISKEEAQASNALKAEFTRLDANKDNKLSMTEFMSATNLASIKIDKVDKSKGY